MLMTPWHERFNRLEKVTNLLFHETLLKTVDLNVMIWSAFNGCECDLYIGTVNIRPTDALQRSTRAQALSLQLYRPSRSSEPADEQK